MIDLYDGTCAYLSMRIPVALTYATVDHFLPKASNPQLAYEWDNYRLCTTTLNVKKGEKLIPLDPFEIREGEFALDLITGEVIVGQTRRPRRVQTVITELGLNDAEFKHHRLEYISWYLSGDMSFAYLERWFPFGAKELLRRGASATFRDSPD